ncbi:hypothetical protein HK099_006601 [Clydaea vesicula]|uniref:DUF2283 domain-containing protein n=1 Tax=Clydaea vesicula TaxID=447962 RepID=A0AAD5TXN6_9FUNG|nr:hypothetical protein HK099_006601 [Clydaea vesicula]
MLFRSDVVFRYSPDVDHLTIYFRKAKPGVIRESDPIDNDVIVDLDEKGKVVHMTTFRIPIVLSVNYDENLDTFKVFFSLIEDEEMKTEKASEYMKYYLNKKGKIAGLLFENASEIISSE